jgi:ribosomal protein S18 acetylase RimI-like enzyme
MDDKQFHLIFSIMEATFPECEIRTYAGQRALLSNPYYRLVTETDDNGSIIAFLAGWEFPLFRFVEHIAVNPAIQGGGIGTKLMSAYIEQSTKPVLLEVEPPDTSIAQRRVSFYERLGFQLNPFQYVQPPLRDGQADLPLNIMSYPQPLKEAEFVMFREILYTEVYKIAVRTTNAEGIT